MKKVIFPILILMFLFVSITAYSQIDSLIVETYYVSDENDAGDTDGGSLEAGSITYRVYLDLSEGYKLMNVFGTVNMPIIISSTEGFFNNTDRGEKFGYAIGSSRLKDNTTPLDTWITLGLATKEHCGILKAFDTDGSIVGGSNNDGGSEGVPGGLLVNDDERAGILLVNADGLIPNTDALLSLVAFGVDDNSIFGNTFVKEFSGSEVAINSNTGVSGKTENNHVLIAQLTTKGEISLKVNVTLQDPLGEEYVFKYDDRFLSGEESFNKWLSYPFKQGCTNPNYLEFDPGAIISDNSCATEIAFGCTDPAACNFDSEANFNIQELCCYNVNNCGDRDVYEVCENYTGIEEELYEKVFKVYPNPANDFLTVEIYSGNTNEYELIITDLFGRSVITNFETENLNSGILDISKLTPGIFFLMLKNNDTVFVRRFIKN
ncbi:MAG: T9SS type A sorting domain-containing protein [Bacteroidales bacterium]|nr:T9SS type A sorting domain-containing protein [Bacteroidales bacterium]MCF8391759.1 T9SS type A sorting domain-containing protein [Bacteroidales bacterium]